jgi:arylsulfatase A-like enzyme
LGVGLTPQISELIADAAIDVIQSSSSPFFLHLNFTAPHDPLLLPTNIEYRYDPDTIPLPKNFRPEHPFDHGNQGGRDEVLLPIPRDPATVQADIAAYYAVITQMDAQIGRILDALDATEKTDSTIVVFASDHGLAMGSHGLRGKQNMYEHTIGVPLIFAGPGVPQNQRFAGQAYLRDIFPTICELAGTEVPNVDGRSQVPVLRGERDSMYEFVIGYFRDSQRMIRRGDWKLIEYPLVGRTQLFDLAEDPLELNNLADSSEHATRRETMSRSLDQWLASHQPRESEDPR